MKDISYLAINTDHKLGLVVDIKRLDHCINSCIAISLGCMQVVVEEGIEEDIEVVVEEGIEEVAVVGQLRLAIIIRQQLW